MGGQARLFPMESPPARIIGEHSRASGKRVPQEHGIILIDTTVRSRTVAIDEREYSQEQAEPMRHGGPELLSPMLAKALQRDRMRAEPVGTICLKFSPQAWVVRHRHLLLSSDPRWLPH